MTPEEARAELIASLERIREIFREDAEDWPERLLRVYFKYSQAIGVDKTLIEPLYKLMLNTRDTRIKTPGNWLATTSILALSTVAAAVTAQHERGVTITDAIRAVSSDSGISRKRVRSFRDELNRGKYGELAQTHYKQSLSEFQQYSKAEISQAVATAGRFVL